MRNDNEHRHHQLSEAIKAQLPLLTEEQLRYFHAALSQTIEGKRLKFSIN